MTAITITIFLNLKTSQLLIKTTVNYVVKNLTFCSSAKVIFWKSTIFLIRYEPKYISAQRLSSYRKRNETKEEVKGHNHPFSEKCGPHCPRNEHYKGPVKRFDFLHAKKQ